MINIEEIIVLIDKLIQQYKGNSLNSLQKAVLKGAIEQPRKNYAQIAHETNYSESYIKHLIAPELWKLLSELLGEKINCTNCRKQLNELNQKISYLERQTVEVESSSLPLELTAQFSQEITPQELILEEPEGQVPLDSPLYVNRNSLESICYQKILEPRAFIWISAPRKMGKTSLMARILQYSTAENCHTVRLSLNQVESELFASTAKFFRWFCSNISYQLHLESEIDNYWNEALGSLVSCTITVQESILKKLDIPLVFAIDEINQLFEYPKLNRDFFALLRYWYQISKNIKIWEKLRLILVNSTDAFIDLNTNYCPYNIGSVIELPVFNQQEITDLIQYHQIKTTDLEIEKIIELTGGFPYLVRLALYKIKQQAFSLESLLANATSDTGIYAQHLHEQLWQLKQTPHLFTAFLELIAANAPVQLPTEVAFKLKSLGLVDLMENKASVSCGLYREYFKNYDV